MTQARVFVLTSEPRLMYYTQANEFRGEIPLGSGVEAISKGEGRFDLVTQKKTYFLRAGST